MKKIFDLLDLQLTSYLMYKILFIIFSFIAFVSNGQSIDEKIAFMTKAKQEGNLNDFVKYDKDILEYVEKIFGKDTNYSNTLSSFSDAFFYLSDFKKAYEYQKEANLIRSKFYDKNHHLNEIFQFTEQLKFVKYSYEINKYEDVTKLENEILNFWKLKFGQDSTYINLVDIFSNSYFELKNYSKTIELIKINLICIENLYSKNIELYQQKLFELSSIYALIGQFEKQLEVNNSCLEITKKVFGAKSEKYAHILNYTGVNEVQLGRYKGAKSNFLLAKNIYENLGFIDSNYLNCLNNLGLVLSDLNEFDKAKQVLYKALKINTEILNNKYESILILGNLATCFFKTSDFTKSIEYNKLALNILNAHRPNEFYTTRKANILQNIALSFLYSNDLINSKIYFDSCLILIDKNDQKFNPIYYLALENIASIKSALGDYQNAQNIYFESLKYYQGTQKNSINEIAILTRIGLNYYYLNDFNNAKKYCLQALKLCEDNDLMSNQIYYDIKNNLGLIFIETREYDQALKIFFEKLEYQKKIFGISHISTSITMNNLALCFKGKKEYEKANVYFKKALNCKQFEINFKLTIKNSLAYSFFELKKYENAIKLFNENRNEIKSIYQDTSYISLNTTLNGLFDCYVDLKDYKKSDSLFLEYLNSSYNILFLNKFGLSEKEILNYSKSFYHSFLFKTEYAISRYNSNKLLLSKCLDFYLNFKNFIDKEFVNESNLKERLDFIKNELNKINESEINKENEQKLIIEQENIERDLIKKSKIDFKIELSKIDQIRTTLENEETFILIQKIPFTIRNKNVIDSSQFVIYLIKNNKIDPDVYFIKNASFIENQIANYSKYQFDSIFYDKFWKAIDQNLGNTNRVYLYIEGELNKINFSTIFDYSTKKYLIDKYQLSYVSNLTDFIKSKQKVNPSNLKNAVLIGNPDFNYVQVNNNLVSNEFEKISNLDDLVERGGNIKALPYTKIEIKNISSILESKNIDVQTFQEKEANEINLKKISHPSILHIATHGFFIEDDKLKLDTNRVYGLKNERFVSNPLLRSGLILSGANNTFSEGSKDENNGFFTAFEASILDLKNTELVVLSACQTGRGKIIDGEGVLGLRKGFKDAGARNLIMSLWKVDDKITQEFMTIFYTNLVKGNSISNAFYVSQIKIKELYSNPYNWGAFILSEY
jgi:CHAT domain-containing protein/tetratricopeptide (TPR) repeat protein